MLLLVRRARRAFSQTAGVGTFNREVNPKFLK